MPMYNLIEYSDNYAKTSGRLSEYYIIKVATGKGDDYTTGCLLDYPYFRDNYKIIAIDLSRQQALDLDPTKIQQINFIANLDIVEDASVYFILKESKETKLDFAQGTVKVL